ncbi:ABC transporter permease [Actinomadura litoris]|uniref:ABC transporter permease n=1 Tax=Actinomadura litoris TaxID=2678616 RepID=A0A7K1L2P9_9ACTN|nr:ABC transporter permease [Actinomadura litoris]MUN38691.1 ABC transporter permease [Actinomadura litoris]
MRAALHAEWTKLRTVAAPRWLLLGAIAATAALGAGAAWAAASVDGGATTVPSLIGVRLGQAPVAVLGVLVIGGEYGTGMIRATLAATPRRTAVLAAKAVVLTGAVAPAGAVAVLGSAAAERLILPAADGPTPRAIGGSVLYLVLIALLGLGVAAIVRDAASGAGAVLALLYLLPVLTRAIGGPRWLQRIGPAGPDGPWTGLGVTAGWAAAALLVGGLLLHVRDA